MGNNQLTKTNAHLTEKKMEILTKLGIDSTLYIQMLVFLVTYMALSRLLFKPYLKAYHKRIEVTFGNQEQAEKLNEAVKDLHIQYEAKAREVNMKAQSYFEDAHKEGQLIQAQALERARKEADLLVESNRKQIQTEVEKTKVELQKHVQELSSEISKKILGKAHA